MLKFYFWYSVVAAISGICFGCLFISRAKADESNAAYWVNERQQTGNIIEPAHEPLAPRGSRLAEMVTESANLHGVPVSIAHAIVKIESGYNCLARSHAGAVGIMQTLPRTARGVGIMGPLTDCATGIEAGMRYLANIVHEHGISCASLSLYERGIAARPRCTAYGAKAIRFSKA